MAYWWVNHNKMHVAELEGGYVWCPQNTDQVERVGYANLTLVEEGDVIFSYAKQKVAHVGIALDSHQVAARPGHQGYSDKHRDWQENGWRVPIRWQPVPRPISPKQHLADLAPYPGQTHGALRSTGDGKESMYLSAVPDDIGDVLVNLLQVTVGKKETSGDREERKILKSKLTETTKKALIDARRGQGEFRRAVINLHRRCLVTGVEDASLLIASHIKAWALGTNVERLDPHNGLLLAPHIDKLFDRGLISFADNGEMLVSDKATKSVLDSWKVAESARLSSLHAAQRNYLAHHRRHHGFD